MLKLKTTAKELLSKDNLTDLQIKHQSLPISKHSLIRDAVNFTKELRMSLQPGFLASHFLSPENKPEQMTHATCGLKQSNALGKYDPNTHSWKTCQGFLALDTSEPSLVLFTKHGIMQNGVLSELLMLAQHIEEKGYGFWPTISAREGRDWSKAKILARLDKGDGLAKRICNKSQTTRLSEQICGLNPYFGEKWMGWPIGWTDLEPLAMDKFQSWPQQHINF